MMRALWTASTGMIAQQMNVDVISNNLSNVNTVGYKKQRAEFKDVLYDTLERAYMLNNQGNPVNLQVGHGTSIVATVRDFGEGSYERTDNPLDMAVEGDAFFMVRDPKGNTVYTRDGSFKLSVGDDGSRLTTSEGYPVLDDAGNDIYLNIDVSKLVVSANGEMSYTDETGAAVNLGQTIGLVKFPNRYGLENIGRNLYAYTSASGYPVLDSELGTKSVINQNYLEMSNVQVVEEMVKLITAQRAYEISSKAIQSSDDMLGIANNLKR